jgi:hypothetical protein
MAGAAVEARPAGKPLRPSRGIQQALNSAMLCMQYVGLQRANPNVPPRLYMQCMQEQGWKAGTGEGRGSCGPAVVAYRRCGAACMEGLWCLGQTIYTEAS